MATCCPTWYIFSTSRGDTETSFCEVMGSRLTRQSSLDIEATFSKRRRQRHDSSGEGERSGDRGGGDFLFTSLMLKSDKLPGMLRKTNHSPYVRRVAWIKEIQKLLREQKMEQAVDVLKLLRKVCFTLNINLWFKLSFMSSHNSKHVSPSIHPNAVFSTATGCYTTNCGGEKCKENVNNPSIVGYTSDQFGWIKTLLVRQVNAFRAIVIELSAYSDILTLDSDTLLL